MSSPEIPCTCCLTPFIPANNNPDMCIAEAQAWFCPFCSNSYDPHSLHSTHGINPNVEIYQNSFNYYYLPFYHQNKVYILRGVLISKAEKDKTSIYQLSPINQEIYLYKGPFFQTNNFHHFTDFFHKIIKLKAFL